MFFPIVPLVLLITAGATFAATNSTPEIEGQNLAARLLALRPMENLTNNGVLQIRDDRFRDEKLRRREIAVELTTTVTATNWQNSYRALDKANAADTLIVIHREEGPNQYFRVASLPQPVPPGVEPVRVERLSPAAVMSPFAGCDFWLADLGLEFLHWPEQRVVKKEMRRGEWCHVLQSVNPQPAPGAYSRVDSWIDLDTGGIVHADAYGQGPKPLKVFEPKKFQKVNGRWEVKSLEIRNEQNNTRTTLIFDLDVKGK